MPTVPVNYVLILIAGVINMALGFAWYSPVLFGKAWMKLSGMTKREMDKGMKEMPTLMGLMFVLTLVMAFILKYFSVYMGAYYTQTGPTLGLTTAFWMWLGFIMPVQLTNVLYAKQPWALFLIHTGYQLVAMLAMGLVLTMF
jgi:hypothetical protein